MELNDINVKMVRLNHLEFAKMRKLVIDMLML